MKLPTFHQKLDGTRSSLRSLYVGQMVQLFAGVLIILLAALLWNTKPTGVSVIVAGVIVHSYGIGCVIVAALVLTAIQGIDYAGSVAEVQSKLARVCRACMISAIVADLSWWLVWIPFVMVFAGLAHVDLCLNAPSVIWIGVAIGVAGLLGRGWLYRYSRSKPDSRLRQVVDRAMIGRSLGRAWAQLDEVRRFQADNG